MVAPGSGLQVNLQLLTAAITDSSNRLVGLSIYKHSTCIFTHGFINTGVCGHIPTVYLSHHSQSCSVTPRLPPCYGDSLCLMVSIHVMVLIPVIVLARDCSGAPRLLVFIYNIYVRRVGQSSSWCEEDIV